MRGDFWICRSPPSSALHLPSQLGEGNQDGEGGWEGAGRFLSVVVGCLWALQSRVAVEPQA